MSVADKDGRFAQIVSDLHACLAMDIQEAFRDAGVEGGFVKVCPCGRILLLDATCGCKESSP